MKAGIGQIFLYEIKKELVVRVTKITRDGIGGFIQEFETAQACQDFCELYFPGREVRWIRLRANYRISEQGKLNRKRGQQRPGEPGHHTGKKHSRWTKKRMSDMKRGMVFWLDEEGNSRRGRVGEVPLTWRRGVRKRRPKSKIQERPPEE